MWDLQFHCIPKDKEAVHQMCLHSRHRHRHRHTHTQMWAEVTHWITGSQIWLFSFFRSCTKCFAGDKPRQPTHIYLQPDRQAAPASGMSSAYISSIKSFQLDCFQGVWSNVIETNFIFSLQTYQDVYHLPIYLSFFALKKEKAQNSFIQRCLLWERHI